MDIDNRSAIDVGIEFVHAEGGRGVDNRIADFNTGAEDEVDELISTSAGHDVLLRDGGVVGKGGAELAALRVGVHVGKVEGGKSRVDFGGRPIRVLIRIELHNAGGWAPEALAEHVEWLDGLVGIKLPQVFPDKPPPAHLCRGLCHLEGGARIGRV